MSDLRPPRRRVRETATAPVADNGDAWINKMLKLLADGTPAQLDYIRDWLFS